MRPKLLAAALFTFFAVPALGLKTEKISVSAQPGPAGSVPGAPSYEVVVAQEAVVWFAHSVSTESRAALVQSVGGTVISDQSSLGWTHIALAPSMSVANALPVLRGISGILRAEPNRVYSVSLAPNDPLFSSQYHFDRISASDGWEFETGASSLTTVAVIDTGIEGTHPDLLSKLAGPTDKVCLDACVDEAGGMAIAACQHGTQVAGFAAAATDNGSQVAGVSWESKLLSMRVFAAADCTASCGDVTADSCSTSDTRIANALNYLVTQQNNATHGHIVANLSLGCLPGPATCLACTAAVQPAIDAALAAGIVVVAAAGNSGPADNTVNRPGACAGVIPVTATDSNDLLASFSSRGSAVASSGLAAPGVGLTGTTTGGTTQGGLSGTSFASPIVAGAAALILSKKPNATVNASTNEVQTILRGTAENIGLSSNLQGSGRLNLYRALRFTANGTLAGVQGAQKPTAFPNPFRPSQIGKVAFAIPPSLQGSSRKIMVYTLAGQFVRELAGMTWDGKNDAGNMVASGTYVFVVTTSAGIGRGRVSVLR